MRRTGARLVVIDTMSKVVAGPENDAPTWNGMHTKTMVALKAEGMSVIQIDHAGKDPERGPRGSSAKHDNSDVVWLLSSHPGGLVKLKREKNRSGKHPERITLQRHANPLRHILIPAGSSVARAATSGAEPLITELAAEHVDRTAKLEVDVQRAVALLDEHDVDRGLGRDRARRALKDAGAQPPGNEILTRAIRARRERHGP